MTLSVAVAAGGTGGHLFPALAVADALRALRPDIDITFIGSTRTLDAALLESRDVAIEQTPVTSFRSRRDMPATLARLVRATGIAKRVIKRRQIRGVIGFGGYPSLPAILAAASSRVPRIVHEANALARLGLANRIGARTGAEVWGGFPQTGKSLRQSVKLCGVPIRQSIRQLDRRASKLQARQHFGLEPAATVVLITGGSLGARRLNQTTAQWVRQGLPTGTQILISTGESEFSRNPFEDSQVKALPFIADMDMAYAAADVVVARAGAATVAELETLGLRAVLVPLPIARESEQDRNAEALLTRGAAAVIPDAQLNVESLQRAVQTLMLEPEPPVSVRHFDAADRLAQRLIELSELSK
jgi:UDP-N-acetylglucosamine--N-acetylmuramyl-(pentapeptide) pyrophosphoryl-undecaprenol N-acetylglucosamine transferase